MADLTVAKVIAEQIGNRAMFMIGAANLVGDETSLQFKIMRNASGITHIRVELVGDLYTMTFSAVRGLNVKTKGSLEGVYAEDLARIIGEKTGLAVSMGPVINVRTGQRIG